MKNQKLVVGVTAVVILIGFALAVFFYQNAQQSKLGFLAEENAETFVRPHSPTMGPVDAQVYLVEYLDPECEACRAFYPHVKKIMKEFEGKIRLVVRYVPFHKNSKHAIAVLEASKKQDKYWDVMDIMFKTQPAWADHHNPQPEKLFEFLPAIPGLQIVKLREDMKDPAIQKIIEQDFIDAKTLGVRGTPTFFVNGKKLTQFGPDPLRAMIRAELK
jgi:protein-disulfide isomerase